MKTIHKSISTIIILVVVFTLHSIAQDKWTNYNTVNSGLPDNRILSLGIDTQGIKWVGGAGLSKFDNTKWTVYTTLNSNIPSDGVYALAIDKNGTKWISAYNLAKFNDTAWTIYGQITGGIMSIAIDKNGIKWMGGTTGLIRFDGSTMKTVDTLGLVSAWAIDIDKNNIKWIGKGYTGYGLVKYNDTVFTTYTNKFLTSNDIWSVHIDKNNTIWLGTMKGLIKYDGDTTWTMYNAANSDLPNNQVNTVTSDASGNLWVGTGSGLAKFDGTNWKVYITTNSSLPNDWIRCLAIDLNKDIWIGTDNGLAVLKEAVGINEMGVQSIFTVYPNPAKDKVSIAVGSGEKVSIMVYDIIGNVISDAKQNRKGDTYQIDLSAQQAGVYFIKVQSEKGSEVRKVVLIK